MKPLLKDKIYNAIFQDIVEGVYRQNEILNEKQLIEKYEVSKSPIRDALMQLCSEGVIVSHPRYGYEVVKIDEKEIHDIILFRITLETNNLRDAYPSMSKADIRYIRDYTLRECSNYEESLNILQHWENNSRFHLKLMEYGDNAYCYEEIRRSIRTMTRAYAQKYWERVGKMTLQMGCEGHLAIIQCLEDEDLEGAVKRLAEDIGSFYELFYPSFSSHLSKII